MDTDRLLQLLDEDGRLLARAAAADPAAPVSSCPGWRVADVVRHTAEVYEHKMACVALAGVRPQPWPPRWPERDPLEWYADAHGQLLEVLTATPASAPSWTWWPPDQTVGFWVRRMAQETVVHRVDVEAAVGALGPVDPELAVDGVDEVLTRMLAGDWSDEPQPGSTGMVAVVAGDRAWQVSLTPERVEVVDGCAPGVTARVSGEPAAVLLWLWGRVPDDAVQVDGPEPVARLRARLALATQ